MYLSTSRTSDAASGVVTRRAETGRRIAANVIALGMVSLVTDISSEMVTAVLPLYYTSVLGLSMMTTGFLDGLYNGVSAFLRLFGAAAADRLAARKLVAAVGYGLSAVCKLGIPLVGGNVVGLGSVLAADRTGKGLRTAPRDALISASSSPQALGRSFGVHRALDTAGSFCGPLVAFAFLSVVATAYNAIFVTSFCVAVLGVLVLLLFVREKKREPAQRKAVSVRAGLRLLRRPGFRTTCVCVAVMEVATISDLFVYLVLQQQDDIANRWFPLLPLGTATLYLVMSLPFGALSDRVSPWRIYLAGQVCFVGVLALLSTSLGGLPLVLGALALHGLFYAASDAPLMVHAARQLPAALKTSGFAVMQSAQAVGMFVSSLLFGTAYRLWGEHRAVEVFGLALVVVIPLAYALMPKEEAR